MNNRNERGMTLIEVLAVLVLVTVIALLIFTVFFISGRYNLTETKKLKMQQNANYIITSILQKHRTVEECYNLLLEDDGEKVVFVDCQEPDQKVVIGEGYQYEFPPDDIQSPIWPREEDFHTTLTIIDPHNPKLFVSVDTTFKRYHSN